MALLGIGDPATRHDPLLAHNFLISLVDTSSPLAFLSSDPIARRRKFGPMME